MEEMKQIEMVYRVLTKDGVHEYSGEEYSQNRAGFWERAKRSHAFCVEVLVDGQSMFVFGSRSFNGQIALHKGE